MADFQEQVMGITGLTIDGSSSAPSRAEFSTFLNDGVIDVTNKSIMLNPGEVESFLRESSEQTSNGFNPGSSKIISVIRESGTDGQWYPCEKKHIKFQYKVTDPESLEYASKYNPVYMVTQNRNVHVYPIPTSGGNDGFKVLYVNTSPEETDGSALDHASTGIKWFPNDKVYLVILYASIRSLQSAIAEVQTNSDITTAFTAANTELDETQAICDDLNTNIDLASTQITEVVTQVDSSVDTALGAMATAAGRIDTAVQLANAEFDKAELEADSAEAEADDAAIATALTAINTNVDSAVSKVAQAVACLDNADGRIDTANAEIDLAKAEAVEIAAMTDSSSSDFVTALDAINTAVDRIATNNWGDGQNFSGGELLKVKDALDKARTLITDDTEHAGLTDVVDEPSTGKYSTLYYLEEEDEELIASTLSIVNQELQRSAAHISEWREMIDSATKEANAFAAEVNARSTFTGAKMQAVTAYISTSKAYLAEVAQEVALASGYNASAQAYIQAAQGFAAEVAAYRASVEIFSVTSKNRINVGNAYLQEANAATQEVQAYGNEVSARLAQVGGYSTVIKDYIGIATAFATEIKTKIEISNSYLTEAQARLAKDTKDYEWYTLRIKELKREYDSNLIRPPAPKGGQQ
jgi:hypothetical protein